MKRRFILGLIVCISISINTLAQETTPPQFKKGDFVNFVRQKLSYPDDAKHQRIQGKVMIAFAVDTLGKVVNARVKKSLGYGCDEEALELVEATSGMWKPAMVDGKKTTMEVVMPIVFSLKP